jgi:hypothetical protein
MRGQLFALILAAGLGVAACGPHGPAYRDINTNQPAKPEQPAPATANEPPPASGANSAEPPQPAKTQPPAFRVPPFMDAGKGYPRDLPNYPQAQTMNIQYGPYGDTDVFSISMHTRDPMDKVVAFYENVFKGNGWTVANRLVDPEYSEWALKKKEGDEAKVTVQKDKQSNNGFFIAVARTAKQQQQQSAKPQP